MQTILAIDDEESIRQSYRMILSKDYHVELAPGGAEGIEYLEKHHVDLVLLDLTMPGMSGEEVLHELRERGNQTPILVVTALNSINTAVGAIKLGARDYIQKPFDVEELQINIRTTLAEERERQELTALREQDFKGFESMTGSSPRFTEALAKAKHAMNVNSAVLITGESGTGKDLIARSIHYGGNRAKKAFVALSCCAIPQQLVESELFGHERGAFTGADKARVGKMKVADGGTLFLDEIGEMPLDAQAKLLRVLQDNRFYPVGSTKEIEVDIRIVCATNRNLLEAIDEQAFRQDLFFRINVLNIEMPPIRQRREDIPMLIAHFVAKHAPKVGAKGADFAPKAISKMAAYSWPGNVRELENSVERLLVYYGQEKIITPDHVATLLPDGAQELKSNVFDEYEGLPLEEATRKMETHLIMHALERTDYVQSKAAEILGTTRRILKYKIDQLGILCEKPD